MKTQNVFTSFIALHGVEKLPLNTLPWDAHSDSLIDPSNITEKKESLQYLFALSFVMA